MKHYYKICTKSTHERSKEPENQAWDQGPKAKNWDDRKFAYDETQWGVASRNNFIRLR